MNAAAQVEVDTTPMPKRSAMEWLEEELSQHADAYMQAVLRTDAVAAQREYNIVEALTVALEALK